MHTIKNDRFLRALKRQSVDATPIWIMRQAGRYLPEYRQVRAKAGDFMTLCRTPELACEVTLQPLKRFDLDAAIVFSDILTIPDAMGMGLHFIEGVGPQFTRTLQHERDIRALSAPDVEAELGYVMETIRLVVSELAGSVPLIGFSGSPWTLACYMLSGGSSKTFQEVKTLLFTQPKLLHYLLAVLTTAVTDYLNAQIAAGVSTVMMFDSWAGLLSSKDYQACSLHYMEEVIRGLVPSEQGDKIPVILFAKGGGAWLEQLAASGCDAISLDWTVDIGRAREQVGKRVALQGNLDPYVLLSTPQQICREVESLLQTFGPHPGHIFNLGHGILPNVPPENVAALVEAVHTGSLV